MRDQILELLYRYADTAIVFVLALVARKIELFFRIRKLFTEEEVMDILKKYKDKKNNN